MSHLEATVRLKKTTDRASMSEQIPKGEEKALGAVAPNRNNCRSVEDRHPESEHRETRDLSSARVDGERKEKAKGEQEANRNNPEIKNRRKLLMPNDIAKVNRNKNATSPSAEFRPASAERLEFSVEPEDAGTRLDRFLAAQLPDLSRTRIQNLIDEGRVVVNGGTFKPSYRIEPDDIVAVEIPQPPPPGVEPEPIPLDILYEDEDIAVVNKPANMIVHPGAGADSGTLVAALLHRFGSAGGLSSVGGPLRPGIVHRLDKGTSGAIVIARTDAAHKQLVEEFREREVEKTYVALLHGKVKGESGRIEMPIARDLHRRSRMTARRREGREARTDWRVRLRLGAFTLVDAGLHTGRTHQIRVHFSALGCPVVGDTLYGAPRQERVGANLLPPLERNFLHALRVAFLHPSTGKRVEFRAPLPPELQTYLRNLAAATGADSNAVDAALKEFL